MRGIRAIFALLLAAATAACASHDSTLDGNASGQAVLYRLSRDDAMEIVRHAIRGAIGDSRPIEHRVPPYGYSTHFRFLLDTYQIDVSLMPAVGIDASGAEVAGYYFDVAGHGSSFLQGRMAASDLADRVKNLAEASGTRVAVSVMRPSRELAEDPPATDETASTRGATALSAKADRKPTIPAAPPDPLGDLRFAPPPSRPDDIAVIVGNSAYDRHGHDIPAVVPAKADAAAIRRYASEALGIPAANVIFLEDATSAQMVEVFGNERDHRGKLFNWVKPKVSRVFVYYAGHGAPAGDQGSPMLVPVDASASQIALSGYPLATLYANLAKLPAESVTVVLEACFSGATAAGSLVPAASPVSLVAKEVAPPTQLTVFSAGAANQIASWRQDRAHGLFTEFFLRGQAGEADQPPYGNGDGRVAIDELERYLKDKVTYWARRDWGRDQNVQIFRPAVASR